jgi:hypothetical protein
MLKAWPQRPQSLSSQRSPASSLQPDSAATVIYRSGHNWKTKRNFEVFSATDFLAAAVEHIPDRYHHTIRYYGIYSNRSRGIEQRRNQASPSCQCAHPECAPPDPPSALSTVTHPQQPNRKLRPLWRDLILRVWGEDPLLCPKCKTTMKVVDKVRRPEEIEFFLKLHNLWEGILAIPPPPDPPFDVETLEPIRTPPEFQWWKPEASDPAQFELQVPHWSPDFEFQDWQQAADSAESATSWQATELTLDAERTLALDSDQPALEEFPEFFYDWSRQNRATIPQSLLVRVEIDNADAHLYIRESWENASFLPITAKNAEILGILAHPA